MTRLFVTPLLAVIVLVALAGACGPAHAAQDDPRLDALFAELQATQDPAEGGRLGRRIAEIWHDSGNPEINGLMREGRRQLDDGNLLAALKRFERVTEAAPGFAEGWTKRAQVLYQMGDFAAAETHLARVLELEPRQFLALAGLGLVHLQLGRVEAARAALEEALAINPHLTGVRRKIEELKTESGG